LSAHLGVASLSTRAQGFQELITVLNDCAFGEVPVS
jgi:hypothetical protein